MRTGLDVRRYHKPSVFFELVDTRWDEYNRVAEMNLSGEIIDARTIVTPNLPPSPGAVNAPPAMNGLPPAGLEDSHRHSEPNPLPGAPVDTLPPPPGAGPTAQRPATGGPQLDSLAGDETALRVEDEGESDDDESEVGDGGTRVRLSSFPRIPNRGVRPEGVPKADSAQSELATAKPARKPSVSRLFSRLR